MFIKIFLFFSFFLTIASSADSADKHSTKLVVGLIESERPPYFMTLPDSETLSGVYIDILSAISRNSTLAFEYKYLPQARIRSYMKNGRLDIEPGIHKSWRTEEHERENSVYSDIFMQSDEVLIFGNRKFNKIPSSDLLLNLRNCAMLGFKVLDEMENDMTRSAAKYRVSTEIQVVRMLILDRCDYSVIPTDVLRFIDPDLVKQIRQSPVINTFDLRFRFHVSHKHLVPEFNSALEELRRDGTIEKIKNKYR